jgi:hypothetical protein
MAQVEETQTQEETEEETALEVHTGALGGAAVPEVPAGKLPTLGPQLQAAGSEPVERISRAAKQTLPHLRGTVTVTAHRPYDV